MNRRVSKIERVMKNSCSGYKEKKNKTSIKVLTFIHLSLINIPISKNIKGLWSVDGCPGVTLQPDITLVSDYNRCRKFKAFQTNNGLFFLIKSVDKNVFHCS